jgi:hypothetical protein
MMSLVLDNLWQFTASVNFLLPLGVLAVLGCVLPLPTRGAQVNNQARGMTMHWPRQPADVRRAALFCLLFVFPSAAFAQDSPARPLDPITAIVDAFKTHDVVALGEGNHGNEQGAAFRKALYRDSRFQAAVNDIVVESGNSRHQAMMDRYIAGENVPEKELRMAWLETTQPNEVWDRDIYGDMFRNIREINQKLPKAKQLRVLLGDNPYTYDPATVAAPFIRSDSFTADLILREVIAKKRKALTVYGDMHYLRRQAELPRMPGQPVLPPPGSIVSTRRAERRCHVSKLCLTARRNCPFEPAEPDESTAVLGIKFSQDIAN